MEPLADGVAGDSRGRLRTPLPCALWIRIPQGPEATD